MKTFRKIKFWWWGGAVLLLAGLGFLGWILIPGLGGRIVIPEPEVWPTNGWQTAAPEEQGLDSAVLAEGLQKIQEAGFPIHSLVIVRDGKLLLEAYFYPYDGRVPHNTASVTKSVTTTLIGIAADQGLLNLDDPLISFFPEYAFANRDALQDRITLRDLASMSGGMQCSGLPDELTVRDMEASPDWVQFGLDLPMAGEPGKAWNYCGVGMHLLSAVVENAAAMSALDFARLNLFEPLGIRDVFWPADPQGFNLGAGNLRMVPTDMARLGLLWLHEGEWDGRQVVSRDWVRASVRPYFDTGGDSYGYGWWISSNEGSPVYNAVGLGGQWIAIDPHLNIVLVTTGGGFETDEILPYILPAIIDPHRPLQANPEGVAQLQATLKTLALPPAAYPVPVLPSMAEQVSGRTYQLEENPVGMQTLRLDFDGGAVALLHIGFADDRQIPSTPVGLDGVYRLTSGLDLDRTFHPFLDFQNLEAGLRGSWIDPQTFALEYDTLENRFYYSMKLQFEADRVTILTTERGSRASATISGRAQNP